jgi:hypothetical protein
LDVKKRHHRLMTERYMDGRPMRRLGRRAVPVSRAVVARWTVVLGLSGALMAVVITFASSHVRYELGDAVFLAANIIGLSWRRRPGW